MWKLVIYLTRYQVNKYKRLTLKKLIKQRNDWINWIRHFRTNWLKFNINCKWLKMSLHQLLFFSHSASDFRSFWIHLCLRMKLSSSEMIDKKRFITSWRLTLIILILIKRYWFIFTSESIKTQSKSL